MKKKRGAHEPEAKGKEEGMNDTQRLNQIQKLMMEKDGTLYFFKESKRYKGFSFSFSTYSGKKTLRQAIDADLKAQRKGRGR